MATPPAPVPQDLLARLAALEARVTELEAVPTAPQAGAPVADAPASAARSSEAAPQAGAAIPSAGAHAAPSAAPHPAPTEEPDPFWALTSLKEHCPAPGAVVFAGAVDLGTGHLEYQWGRPTEHLLATDWAEHAETVAALGHPLRLAMLRRLLDGEHTVAQLVDELGLASTGVAYHHLSALQGAGWAVSPRRGSWAVSASRAVPLLAIITALEKG